MTHPPSEDQIMSWLDRGDPALEHYLRANPLERARIDRLRSALGQMRQSESPSNSLPEHALEDYRIVRTIGEGGMGVVYEAI